MHGFSLVNNAILDGSEKCIRVKKTFLQAEGVVCGCVQTYTNTHPCRPVPERVQDLLQSVLLFATLI